jgi:hypothetical protein
MGDPKHPKVGDLSVDASDIQVTDITPEQVKKLTKVRDGFEKAIENVVNLKPEAIDRAGLNEKDIQRLTANLMRDQRIAELLPASEKLVELLHETRQLGRHEMATILGEFAAQTRRRADRSSNASEILGPLEVLLDYQYGPAMKATATKEKAKGAQAEPNTGNEGEGGGEGNG